MEEIFNSPTYGQLDKEGLKKQVSDYMTADKTSKYRIIVGADSQRAKSGAYDFVVALAIHRVGSGGIYFWTRDIVKKQMALKQRMYQEAIMSLQSAEKIVELFRDNGIVKCDVEVHVDIGQNGDTRDMIGEIVGMIRGSGYNARVKPDSYVASKVADRHT